MVLTSIWLGSLEKIFLFHSHSTLQCEPIQFGTGFESKIVQVEFVSVQLQH